MDSPNQPDSSNQSSDSIKSKLNAKSLVQQSLVQQSSNQEPPIDERLERLTKSNSSSNVCNRLNVNRNPFADRHSSADGDEASGCLRIAIRNCFYKYVLFGCMKIHLPSDD